ncbi:hypothetical protein ACHQM5_019913 [Ranunculus cassubicifolius]
MSATKDQVPLNGAYYGPSVPPQQFQSQRRKRGCFSIFLITITTIIVVLGIAALVAWLVVRPKEVKWYAIGADLKQFNLNNSNTLNYDLTLNMRVRNPNKRVGVYYDRIEATVSYKGERFGWAGLPTFYQGHKNTTDLVASFQGQQVVQLNRNEIDRFTQEMNNGGFEIDVKIYLRIRYKVGSIKSRRIKPDVECDLRIPLAANGTTTMFVSRRCDFDY